MKTPAVLILNSNPKRSGYLELALIGSDMGYESFSEILERHFPNDPFCIAMQTDNLAILCNDNGLLIRPQLPLTLVRPWDSQPLVGPMVICGLGDEDFEPMDLDVATLLRDAFFLLGWRC